MARKCISTYTGKPRAAYNTYEEAKRAADAMRNRGMDFYPYRCNGCGKFHIAPAEDRIDFAEVGCSCTDSDGNGKNLYRTYEDAAKARAAAMSKRRVFLMIYECPEGKGWHLTHKKTFLELQWKKVAAVIAGIDLLLLVFFIAI